MQGHALGMFYGDIAGRDKLNKSLNENRRTKKQI